MQTDKWGPHLWEYLHTTTFNYPLNPTPSDKANYKNLFHNLKFTMPCKYCRESYSIIYDHYDIDIFLNDRNGITFWLYCIHNIINVKLNKPFVSFEHVVHKYENIRARCNNYSKNDCTKFLPFDSNMQSFVEHTYDKYTSIIIKLSNCFINHNINKINNKNFYDYQNFFYNDKKYLLIKLIRKNLSKI